MVDCGGTAGLCWDDDRPVEEEDDEHEEDGEFGPGTQIKSISLSSDSYH